MSLYFEKQTNSIKIADIIKNAKFNGEIYYKNIDDIPEDEQLLTKMRLNEENESFFPSITNFNDSEQVDRVYITGETGVGKTSFIRKYIIMFTHKYPKSKIFFISSKQQDKEIDDLPVERIKIDDDILINRLSLIEFSKKSKPSLIVFDDVEDFQNKKINVEIARFRDEVMRNGRSYGMYSLFVNHNPCDYYKTRSQIFEANKIVIFPRRSGSGTYDYLLEKKLNLNKEIVKMINNLKSSFVCINKNIPKIIISDKYIIIP